MACATPPGSDRSQDGAARSIAHAGVLPLEGPGADQAGLALAIDLDGTLSRTDTLLEQLFRLIAIRPWALLRLLGGLSGGRASVKRSLAAAMPLEPARLVFDEAVLDLARAARAAGRPVVLATAADREVATSVATHLGLFDAVFASDGVRNLKGVAKAAALERCYGRAGFDYVGDSAADRPVWRAARRAYIAGGDATLAAALREEGAHVIVVGEARAGRAGAVLAALRPHQWAKNLLVLAPGLAAHRLGLASLGAGAVAFAAFSLCASSLYVLNDLLDLPHDRAHPAKRCRPFASGALPLAWGPAMIAALLGAALLLAAATLPAGACALLFAYLVATLLYSLGLKRRPVWDVMTLAGLYTIRIFAGGAACHVPVSPWLLAFSLFLFFCLAVMKRQTELVRLVREGGHAAPGRGYASGDLDMLRSMATSSGMIAVLVLALYLNSPDVLTLYPHPHALWALCPILLFWVSRVLMMSARGLLDDDPVVFALRDRVSLGCGAACLAAVLAGAA